jgi:hypothetical protein
MAKIRFRVSIFVSACQYSQPRFRFLDTIKPRRSGETLMKATKLYRTASVLLFLVAIGNTFGLLNFWHAAAPLPPVRFPIGHAPFSYAQVVLGYQVFCSFCVLFAAYLAWHLGTLARRTPQAIGAMGWVLFAYLLVGVYISWIFFSGFVLLLTAAIAACIGWATGLITAHRRMEQEQSKHALA